MYSTTTEVFLIENIRVSKCIYVRALCKVMICARFEPDVEIIINFSRFELKLIFGPRFIHAATPRS